MSTQEPLPRAYEPAQVEAKWFPKWEAAGNFHGKPNPEKKPYSIVIPPPNVTGILTLGHDQIARTIDDNEVIAALALINGELLGVLQGVAAGDGQRLRAGGR